MSVDISFESTRSQVDMSHSQPHVVLSALEWLEKRFFDDMGNLTHFTLTESVEGDLTIANIEEDDAVILEQAVLRDTSATSCDGPIEEKLLSTALFFSDSAKANALSQIHQDKKLVVPASLSREQAFPARRNKVPKQSDAQLAEPRVVSFASNLALVNSDLIRSMQTKVAEAPTVSVKASGLVHLADQAQAVEAEVRKVLDEGLFAVHSLDRTALNGMFNRALGLGKVSAFELHPA